MVVPGGSKKKGSSASSGADAGKEEYADEYKIVYAEARLLGEKVVMGTA